MWIPDQPLTTGGVSRFVWSLPLEKAFKLVDRFGEEYNAGIKVDGFFDVPRGTCPLGKKDERVSQPVVALNCKIELRDDQPKCVNESVGWLKGGKNHVLEAPTGWGKCYAGTAIACGLGQKTLIVVTKNDLKTNWVAAIQAAGHTSIGLAQGKVADWKDRQFVVGMVQSLIRPDKYPPEFFKQFGLVIIDEVHHMAADSFVQVCRLFPALYRLGLSATPQRGDGRWPLIQGHIGPTLVKGQIIPMQPKVLIQKTGWWMPKRREFDFKKGEYVQVPIPHAPGKMMHIMKLMAADHKRNEIIVKFVKDAYDSGRNIVVMSDLIDDHLKPLFFKFAAAGIPGEHMGYYIGGKSDPELKAAAAKRVVLASYAMCSEGTNFPVWDTLVMATPRANCKQPVGRVLRRSEGKKTPVVFDLVDADQIFQGFFLSREKQYFSLKSEIVRL